MIVYSALYPNDAHLMMLEEFDEFKVAYKAEHLVDDNSILLLHGGADINPSLYGQKPIKNVWCSENRDEVEVALAQEAIRRNIPIFGICRGAQLLCALAGGSLIQHVTGHNGEHRITTVDGEMLRTTSSHHQMMNPEKTDHELLAWASHSLSKTYLVEEEKEVTMKVEPEIVYFPKIRGLGVQGHPEWVNGKSKFAQHCLNLISEKLLNVA